MTPFTKVDRVRGIDTSASAVKLVELSQSDQRIRVEALAIEPLPEKIMKERNPSDLDGSVATIKRSYEISDSRLKKAAVAIPTSSLLPALFPCLQNSDVLLVASRQENVDLRRDVLQAGCQPESYDCKCRGLCDGKHFPIAGPGSC